MKQIETNEEYQKVLNDKNVVIYHSAIWCGPCKIFGPIIESVVEGNSDFTFYKVDVDKIDSNVMSIPTVFVTGRERVTLIGISTREKLNSTIESVRD